MSKRNLERCGNTEGARGLLGANIIIQYKNAVGPVRSAVLICTMTASFAWGAETVTTQPATTGRLIVEVHDAKSGRLLAARLSLTCSDGSRPWGSDAAGKPLAYGDTPRYWIDGDCAVDIPAGQTEVVISRPYTWRPFRTTVMVPAGGEVRVRAPLEPVVDLIAEGWYGGDAHDHVVHGEREFAVDIALASRIAAAEGLDWSAFSGRWTSIDKQQPSPAELNRRCAALTSERFLADWNLEHPKDHLGHMAAFPHGLDETYDALSGANSYRATLLERPRFAHSEILRGLQAAGTFAVYTHPTREHGGTPESVANIARELPFLAVAAPELLVGLDVMTDVPGQAPDEQLYHLLLNRGLRLPLCAFTDTCYDRRASRPGDTRTYVHLGNWPRNMDNIKKAILAGRTFGSSGPIVLFAIDGHGPGDVLAASDRKRMLRIRAYNAVDYRDPRQETLISRIEVIRNGEVWKTHVPSDSVQELVVEYDLVETNTAWYVVRVCGGTRYQVAISSPIYFEGDDYVPLQSRPAHVQGSVTGPDGERIQAGVVRAVLRSTAGDETVEAVEFTDGHFTLTCPATCRLIASAEGYQARTQSIFLDSDTLFVDLFWGVRRSQLIDPDFYKRIETALDKVRLDFELGALPHPGED